MADVGDVVTAMAARLSAGMAGTAIGGRIHAFAPDTLDPPCAVVLPSPGEFVTYDVAMGGVDDFELVIKVMMGTQDDRSGQAELLTYFDRSGSASLLAAIYADKTLGGVVADCKVTAGRAYGDVEWGSVLFFGGELAVMVFG